MHRSLRLVEGGVKEETKQILRNLDTVLQAGCKVKTRSYE
jgi:hypothetical protein